MKRRSLGILGFLLGTFVVLVAPLSQAQKVDERIHLLTQELEKLKAEQEQVKSEHLQLKKEASAAAAALPAFAYRPGRGMTITAADKSWGFNVSSQLHLRLYNYLDGNDADGAVTGKLFGRRMRLFTNYCWVNCFYDLELSLDMDQSDIPVELRRAQLDFNFNQ